MYDMVHVIEGLSKQIADTLNELSQTRDLDEKKKLAEIVKMLCESLSVFFDGMDMLADGPFDLFDDDDEEMFYDDGYSEDVVDFSSLKKNKKDKKDKKKKKDRDDIPF
ncbi:hypothetical protein JCM14469_35050 [Desulfatiferula olefinivorans]